MRNAILTAALATSCSPGAPPSSPSASTTGDELIAELVYGNAADDIGSERPLLLEAPEQTNIAVNTQEATGS